MIRPDGRPMDRNERTLLKRALRHDPKLQGVRFYERDGIPWVEVTNNPASILCRPAEDGDAARWPAAWAAFKAEGSK